MLDFEALIQAEEAARNASAQRIARIREQGGTVSIYCDRVNGKTIITQAGRDASGEACMPTEIKGELWNTKE
jgi:hypothetical protein